MALYRSSLQRTAYPPGGCGEEPFRLSNRVFPTPHGDRSQSAELRWLAPRTRRRWRPTCPNSAAGRSRRRASFAIERREQGVWRRASALGCGLYEVYPGEVVGLIGDNGAGKSTLIKVIAGVYVPDSGEIYVDGKRVRISAPQDATQLGIGDRLSGPRPLRQP